MKKPVSLFAIVVSLAILGLIGWAMVTGSFGPRPQANSSVDQQQPATAASATPEAASTSISASAPGETVASCPCHPKDAAISSQASIDTRSNGQGAAQPIPSNATSSAGTTFEHAHLSVPPKGSLPLTSTRLESAFPISADQQIEIQLPNAGSLQAKVTQTTTNDSGRIVAIAGTFTEPEAGTFWLSEEPEGMLAPFSGGVLFNSESRAWKVIRSDQGVAHMVEVSPNDVTCVAMLADYSVDDAETDSPSEGDDRSAYFIETDDVYQLQSNPGSQAVVYLDFDGEPGPFTGWSDGPPSASESPMNKSADNVRYVWRQIAEDFAPFNINVTTSRSVYNNAPANSRTHCIFTPDRLIGAPAGAVGVAKINSFNSSSTMVCWSWSGIPFNAAGTASHEIGHTLNLDHDGIIRSDGSVNEYYGGHGSDGTSWAPIMGSHLKNVNQWSNGSYPNASNTENDLLIIRNNNRVSLRGDDHGATFSAATSLPVAIDSTFSSSGIIGINNLNNVEGDADVDAFKFTVTEAKELNLRVDPPDSKVGNLDVLLELADSSGTLIASNNPLDKISASISTRIQPGTYQIRVKSTGKPANGNDYGYPIYASLGQYDLTGQLEGAWVANSSTNLLNWAQYPAVVATQSSDFSSTSIPAMTADRAIDGSTAGSNTSSLSHTQDIPNSWWKVDLGQERPVGSVVLWNRQDSSLYKRLSNFSITFWDGNGNQVFTQNYYTGSSEFVPRSATLTLPAPVMARSMEIRLLGRNNAGNGILCLAEVQVFAPQGTDLSSAASARQSTTSGNASALLALDNDNGTLATTNSSTAGNWWEIKWSSVTRVDQILITPATGDSTTALSNFKVTLFNGNTVVYSNAYNTSSGSVDTVLALHAKEFLSGDRLRIELLGNTVAGNSKLSLAEVKILGQSIPQPVAPSRPIDTLLDSDNDGVSNLTEYYLGTSSTTASAVPVTSTSTGLSFLLRKPTATSGVTTFVQTSTDMLIWTDRNPADLLAPDQSGVPADFQRLQIQRPTGTANPRLFFRIRAVSQP